MAKNRPVPADASKIEKTCEFAQRTLEPNQCAQRPDSEHDDDVAHDKQLDEDHGGKFRYGPQSAPSLDLALPCALICNDSLRPCQLPSGHYIIVPILYTMVPEVRAMLSLKSDAGRAGVNPDERVLFEARYLSGNALYGDDFDESPFESGTTKKNTGTLN